MKIRKVIAMVLAMSLIASPLQAVKASAEEKYSDTGRLIKEITVDTLEEHFTNAYEIMTGGYHNNLYYMLYSEELAEEMEDLVGDMTIAEDLEFSNYYENPTGFWGAHDVFPLTINRVYYEDWNNHTYQPSIYLSQEEYDLTMKTLNEFKKMNFDGLSDREVIRKAVEWIKANMTYGKAKGDDFEGGDMYDIAINAMKTKYGVCGGYTALTAFILDALGYEVTQVSGMAGGTGNLEAHGWNAVKLDGKWYELDVTWMDATNSKGENKYQDEWFLKELSGKDSLGNRHIPSDVGLTWMGSDEQLELYNIRNGDYNGTGRTPLRAWVIGVEDTNKRVSVGDKITLNKDKLTGKVESSNPDVVRVNGDGTLTALKPGRSNISRYSANGEYVSTFYVLVKDEHEITMDVEANSTIQMQEGSKLSLNAKSSKGKKITYRSDHKTCASVNSNGVITANKVGWAWITVKSDGIERRITVEVVKPSNKITMAVSHGETISLPITDKFSLDAKSSCGEKVKYKSSDTSIATVNSSGVITGKKTGTATITITSNGADTQKVKVKVLKPSISGLNSSYTIKKGDTITINYTQKNKGNLAVKTTVSSSAKKYVTVGSPKEASIRVKGKKVGKTSFTIKLGNYSKTIKINVTK